MLIDFCFGAGFNIEKNLTFCDSGSLGAPKQMIAFWRSGVGAETQKTTWNIRGQIVEAPWKNRGKQFRS